MDTPTSPRAHPALRWSLLALALLIWNGVAAMYATPLIMIQVYDGTQYHLLARNRLQGHHEMGNDAHTVRLEGQHPIWRPGLVWIEELLARCCGSVATAAAIASALGATLLELAIIWLAWRCYGRAAAIFALVCMIFPYSLGSLFLCLAVGQGPEPWAAAAVVGGLACLVEAMRRRSWNWALAAGLVGGAAELFRTGNWLLFLVPGTVVLLFELRRRDRGQFGRVAVTLATFVVMVGVTGLTVRSPVDKTAVNFWHRLVEWNGPKYPHPDVPEVSVTTGGLAIAPESETHEVYYDYIVRKSQGESSTHFFREHSDELLSVYFHGLGQVVSRGAFGLRFIVGNVLVLFFLVQVVLSLAGRSSERCFSLALAAGALAHYLGPVVLLRGDDPCHYLFVAVPLFLVVGSGGAIRLGQFALAGLARWRPEQANALRSHARLAVGIAALPVLGLVVPFYLGAIDSLRANKTEAVKEQADVDALHLEGRRVAVRNMSWFTDRNVETVLLPYATVPELEEYAHAQDVDGILVWNHERHFVLEVMPDGNAEGLEHALEKSTYFGPPVVSGGWHYYPVRRDAYVSRSHGK